VASRFRGIEVRSRLQPRLLDCKSVLDYKAIRPLEMKINLPAELRPVEAGVIDVNMGQPVVAVEVPLGKDVVASL
jgi:hypothetical protein